MRDVPASDVLDLDVSAWPPGTYVVRATVEAPGGASSVSRRFVVGR